MNEISQNIDLKSMRINDNIYLNLEEDLHIAYTVRMKRTYVLKPNTAKICIGKVRNSPDLPSGQDYEVQQVEKGFIVNEPGLRVINSVSTLKNNRTIAFLVVNKTDKHMKIYRHCLLAKIRSIQNNDVKMVNSVIQGQNIRDKIDFKDLKVTEKYMSEIQKLITENVDLFASKDSELGHTDTVKMKVDTGKHEPIKLKPYRTPINNRQIIDNAIDEMLEAGVIRRSRSPWSFPVVIVDKKDGSKRFCVDFRKLNQITVKNSFPLPLIDDMLTLLGNAKFFTSLDLKSGYWQVLMDESDREKTAFATHKGLFEFLVMPFGLSNAPAIFQELMSIVLQGLGHFAVAYLDDIMIFSETFAEHMEHLNTIFSRLRKHGLKLKLKKCSFLQAEKNYLGFVVDKHGIKPDPKKVEAIRSLPVPTSVRLVRSFIGMCSYYRGFIPNFSEIAEPIMNLTRKHAHFKWTPMHQNAFDYLKDNLSVVPLLVYPNPNQKYTLYTDASDMCIGACLTQECDVYDAGNLPNVPIEKPWSNKLNKTQCKWSTIEKEAYAIYYSLQKLDYYLHNAEFTIKSDHKPLKYLLDAPIVQ